MAQEIKSKETKLSYDDRRKILNQKKTEITEYMTDEVKDEDGKVTEEQKLMSTVSQTLEVNYTEEGIRLAHNNMMSQKESFEKQLVDLKEKFNEVGEIPKELKEFKDKLTEILKYDEAEKSKANHESVSEELKKVNKDLNELKDEIGTRLKL